ncbi:MAG: hypothetical protein LBJ12_08160 [Oscillospiraceae bacterium]|nr:hypothetical protein [Oscillospiraceae bacterium]
MLDVKGGKALIVIKNCEIRPFVIASGYSPDKTEWDSGKYFSNFSEAAYYWNCEEVA